MGKGGNIYSPKYINYQINSIDDNNIKTTVVVELSDGGNTIQNEHKDYINYEVTFNKNNDNWIITSYEKQD